MLLVAAILVCAVMAREAALQSQKTNNALIHIFGNTENVSAENRTYTVSCESDSMGFTVSCNDYLITQQEQKLRPGSIYVYKKENGTNVVHRLALCVKIVNETIQEDKECTDKAIFKGDANRVAEIVNVTQITGKVKWTNYR